MALGLIAVQTAGVSEHPVYVSGGRKLDKNFLSALDLPADMRVLLYQNRSQHFSPDSLLDPSSSGNGGDPARPADKLAPLIEAVQRHNQEMSGTVSWSSDPADEEVFHAIPLRGVRNRPGKDQSLQAILLVGNSRRSYVELKRRIGESALLVGGGGIIVAILLRSWAAARVTRPWNSWLGRRAILGRGIGTRESKFAAAMKWRSLPSPSIA